MERRIDFFMLERLINNQLLPRGIGVDCVNVLVLRDLNLRTNEAFCLRTFSEMELIESEAALDKWTYLAGRFAAKEAVFKALAPLLPGISFDFRQVETLWQRDGSPRVNRSPWLLSLLEKAGVDDILVSITNEEPYAIAFSLAVKNKICKEYMT